MHISGDSVGLVAGVLSQLFKANVMVPEWYTQNMLDTVMCRGVRAMNNGF
jgi:hypothetical protein